MSSSELSCPYTSGLSFRLQYASKLEEEYKSLHALSIQTHDHHVGLESFFPQLSDPINHFGRISAID